VLASRRYWIELSFTPIAIVLGCVGAVVCALRALIPRRPAEIVPLAVLVMAAVQYLVFEQGADIHVYWPHYFAQFFALAMGALAASLLSLAQRFSKASIRAPALVALVLLLPLAWIMRDAMPALAYARATGGRFNEKGLYIESGGDKIAFLRWLAPSIEPAHSVALHPSMKADWSQVWALGRATKLNVPIDAADDVLIADARRLDPKEQDHMARELPTIAVGPYWYARIKEPHAPIEAYSFDEQPPGIFAWYFLDGTEPVRTLRIDPYLTWELRAHFDQAAELPPNPPTTFEERRIAHNMAVARGDAPDAAALERALTAELGEPHVLLPDGTELLGARYDRGVEAALTLVFRAGVAQARGRPGIRSRVIDAAAWSTTMADPTVRDVGPPMVLSPQRWREGFLYSYRVIIRKRPGRERFVLVWQGSQLPVLEL
jgi:hypothetical protein